MDDDDSLQQRLGRKVSDGLHAKWRVSIVDEDQIEAVIVGDIVFGDGDPRIADYGIEPLHPLRIFFDRDELDEVWKYLAIQK